MRMKILCPLLVVLTPVLSRSIHSSRSVNGKAQDEAVKLAELQPAVKSLASSLGVREEAHPLILEVLRNVISEEDPEIFRQRFAQDLLQKLGPSDDKPKTLGDALFGLVTAPVWIPAGVVGNLAKGIGGLLGFGGSNSTSPATTGAPNQAPSQWGQPAPYQQQGGQWGQPVPNQQQGGQWGQPVPNQQQGSQWGQPVPNQQQGGQWGQPVPNQQQGGQWGQPAPNQQQGGQRGQPAPNQQQGGQWGQPVPSQQQGGQWGQPAPNQGGYNYRSTTGSRESAPLPSTSSSLTSLLGNLFGGGSQAQPAAPVPNKPKMELEKEDDEVASGSRYIQCEGNQWSGRCPDSTVCVGDPRSRGVILDSICVPTAKTCGGSKYTICDPGYVCIADPRQSNCQPLKGDYGCIGLCV